MDECHDHPGPDEIRAAASILGRIGALESWARTKDRSARTAPAREARARRHEVRIRAEHPDWSDAEVLAAADAAKRAEYARMALLSAESRRAKAGR